MLAALALYFIINRYVIRMAMVYGSSMEPVLSYEDRVLLSPLPYFFSNPKVGDIIAFPLERGGEEYLVKRVAAVGGDVVELIDGIMYINDELVYDVYSKSIEFTSGNIAYPLVVPENTYFVLGDNKNGSLDSRFAEVGCVPKNKILGKIILRVYPFSKFGFVK